MRRIATMVAALMLPVQAQALGVGDIDWSSALNQPLNAEIALFAVGSTSQHEIQVKLAPYEAYKRADIEFPSILRELKFSVEQRQNGEFYIKVRSSQAIQDPFLDILIEIDWPSGHLLREYTLLLDLPVMTDEVAGPVSSPVAASAPMAETDGMAATAASSVTAAERDLDMSQVASTGVIYGESSSRYGSGDLRYGMIKRGDTLWAIAESMRGDQPVSVQQVMMALLKNNPDAFYKNNINNLKAGYVLHLDNPALLTAMTRSDAADETKRQHQAWLATKKGATLSTAITASGAMDRDEASLGAGAESGAEGPSLRLVSPDEADVVMAATTVGAADLQSRSFTNKELETLRLELNSTMVMSESGHEENSQLRTRIGELEEQIAKMQSLLSLRDDALSVLQLQSQDESATSLVAEAEVDDEALTDKPSMSSSTVKDAESVAAADRPVAPVAKTTPALTQEQGFVDGLLAFASKAAATIASLLSPAVLGGIFGGGLLLAGGAWFLRKRKMSAADLEQSMMIEVADKQLSDDMASGTVSDLSEPKEETGAADLLDKASGEPIDGDLDEIDVLAEADVYLAYQRFDRAEELLHEAVEHEPQRHDLMLKLMEVFVASKNRDGFIATAERCQAHDGQQNPAVWGKVMIMAKDIAADHPLFSDASVAIDADTESSSEREGDDLGDVLPGADLGFDLDDDLMAGLDDSSATDKADSSTAVADELSNELDDLVFDGGDKKEPATESALAELSDDKGLDLDSGLDFPISDEPASDDVAIISGEADDVGLEFDAGLDLNATDELVIDAGVKSDSANALTTEPADAAGLDFDVSELSLDDGLVAEPEAAATDNSSAGVDEGLAFDSSALESATTELQSEVAEADENANAVLLEVEKEDLAIDAELLDDIDWLSDAADEAVDGDDASDSFFSSEDEVATKLDLVRAYIDMGDKDSARNILTEVVEEGNDEQKKEAQELLDQIG